MELIELRCRGCGAPLAEGDLDPVGGFARCGHCRSVFGLRTGQAGASSRKRAPVPLPKRIEVQDIGAALQLTRRWFGAQYVFLLVFCLFWNGFLLFWHGMAIASGNWFMSVFALLHTAVGIGLAYVVAAGFLNRTTIRIGLGVLEVRHAPLPWPGAKTIAADGIAQVFCLEKVARSKNGTSITYEVHAKTAGGTERIVSGLEEVGQALFLEQEIERFLRIEDRPVAGEVERG